MAKTLLLHFVNADGKTANIAVEGPTEPVSPTAVNAAMDKIIAANVFITSGGSLTGKKGASLVERNVTDIVL